MSSARPAGWMASHRAIGKLYLADRGLTATAFVQGKECY
jgi:hypothetical protein